MGTHSQWWLGGGPGVCVYRYSSPQIPHLHHHDKEVSPQRKSVHQEHDPVERCGEWGGGGRVVVHASDKIRDGPETVKTCTIIDYKLLNNYLIIVRRIRSTNDSDIRARQTRLTSLVCLVVLVQTMAEETAVVYSG